MLWHIWTFLSIVIWLQIQFVRWGDCWVSFVWFFQEVSGPDLSFGLWCAPSLSLCSLSGRSLYESLFVRCALGPDGIYRYWVSAWLPADWGRSHGSMEAISKPKTELLCLTGGTWPGVTVPPRWLVAVLYFIGVSTCDQLSPSRFFVTVARRNCQ